MLTVSMLPCAGEKMLGASGSGLDRALYFAFVSLSPRESALAFEARAVSGCVHASSCQGEAMRDDSLMTR